MQLQGLFSTTMAIMMLLGLSGAGGGLAYAQGIDVVFKIDESGSMGDDIAAVQANVVTIFNGLPAGSGVGLVGFGTNIAGLPHGALPNIPHVHTDLTSDLPTFQSAVNELVATGGVEPGYDAVVQSADGTLGLTFSGAPYCNILISDEPPNGDVNTQADAITALQNAGAVFFGITLSGSATTSYQPLANNTGGQMFDLNTFKSDPTGVLTAVLDACVAAVELDIEIEPDEAENNVGEDHTVTATITDLESIPQEGVEVTFEVISGPNAGASGTCSLNADCTTDALGQVSFTYSGVGGMGTDKIKACFTPEGGQEKCEVVTKDWINTPPDCTQAYADPDCLWPPNHKFVDIAIMGVTDPDGDPVTISISSITSDEPTATDTGSGGATHSPDASGLDTDTASLRSERSGNGDGRVYTINFVASDDKGGMCEGSVEVNVPHDQSDKDCPATDSGQNYIATDIN